MFEVAIVDLGLAVVDFWALTLRELVRLIDRRNLVRRRECDIPAALVCSVIANVNRDSNKRPEPYTVDDFLAADPAEAKADQVETRDPAADHAAKMLAKCQYIAEMFSGLPDDD